MVSRVRPPEIASFTLVRSLSIRSPARICVEISDRWQSCGWQSLTPTERRAVSLGHCHINSTIGLTTGNCV